MIEYQVLDVAGPVEILASCSRAYHRSLEANQFLPPGSADKAIDIEFLYIGEQNLDPVLLTGNCRVVPTTTCDACPPLDFLLVGGPDPFKRIPERFCEFLRAHVETGKTLFATCTGAMAVAESGVLDGRNATANHGVVPMAKKVHPAVKWTADAQWVVDGPFWTAGGACAGMDMMAHWVVENYGVELAKVGCSFLDFQPRDVRGNPGALAKV